MIDTGAFIARFLSNDQHHFAAKAYWKKLENETIQCFTTNFIIDESLTLLSRRAGIQNAFGVGKMLYHSPSLIILRPEQDDELLALKQMEKFGDHQISFTDCISYCLMKSHHIPTIFTFDAHFSLMGVKCVPTP